jgi:hypothetical protein
MPAATVVVGGNNTNSLSFLIPPGVVFDVQSVVASIDASGAGDTIPELEIFDKTGVVIATKRQGLPTPAGDTGLATWALRLDDETKAGGAFTAEVGHYVTQRINYQSVPPNTPTYLNWTYFDGTPLLDLTTPDDPTVLAAGFYLFFVTVEVNVNVAGGTWGVELRINPGFPPHYALQTGDIDTFPIAGVTPTLEVSQAAQMAAGDDVQVRVGQDAGANRDIGVFYGTVAKLG